MDETPRSADREAAERDSPPGDAQKQEAAPADQAEVEDVEVVEDTPGDQAAAEPQDQAELGPDAGEPRKYRRRKLIVDREFQFRFLAIWLFILISVLLCVAIVFFSTRAIAEKGVQGQDADVLRQLEWSLKLIGVLLICATIFFALYALLLSHRIAGPAYRLKQCMRAMIGGEHDFSVTLRKGDYLKDLAAALDELNQVMRAKDQNLRMTLEEAQRFQAMLDDGRLDEETRQLLGRVIDRLSATVGPKV